MTLKTMIDVRARLLVGSDGRNPVQKAPSYTLTLPSILLVYGDGWMGNINTKGEDATTDNVEANGIIKWPHK